MKKRILIIMFAILLLTGCSNAGHYTEYTTATVGDSSSDYKQISLDELDALETEGIINYSFLDSEKRSNKEITIDGHFVDFDINGYDSVFAALASLADIMKLQDVENEMKVYLQSGSHGEIYSFQQYYKGVEVYNGRAMIIVDVIGKKILRLSTNYYIIDSLDTKPKLNLKTLYKTVSDNYSVDIDGEPQLIIYTGELGSEDALREPVLAWRINLCLDGTLDSLDRIIIDDSTGEVIHERKMTVYYD